MALAQFIPIVLWITLSTLAGSKDPPAGISEVQLIHVRMLWLQPGMPYEQVIKTLRLEDRLGTLDGTCRRQFADYHFDVKHSLHLTYRVVDQKLLLDSAELCAISKTLARVPPQKPEPAVPLRYRR